MANHQKDFLFVLIKSLSKSEKRQFKIFASRLETSSNTKFIELFNILDKSETYDEKLILKSGSIKKVQLSNLKSYLYKQILVSIRLNIPSQNIRYQLREQIDFAVILYNKGLYKQSLKILDKTKQQALENDEKYMAYEIVEFEKLIESQYITRSIQGRADELVVQAKELNYRNTISSKLSNLSLQLYGIMLKTGYVKSDEEYKYIDDYFNKHIAKLDETKFGFREKYWFYNANLWRSFLVQDFLASYKFAYKWVQLFYDNPNMIYLNPVFFLKGNHYFLESLYMLKYTSNFKKYLSLLEETIQDPRFPVNDNLASLSFLYLYNNKLNLHILEGTFAESEYLIPEILEKLKVHSDHLDEHHEMLFFYKIASIYFGNEKYNECIFYLDKIINNKNLTMREDLMCFARLLSLIAHYELGKDYYLENHLKSTYKFLLKMNDLHEVQKEIIKFLRNLNNFYPADIKKEFKKMHARFVELEKNTYEKRAFLYLDIISWLESKIENRKIADIIKEKAKLNSR
ncbi:hypothetical protein [Flavobacterium johnsoniae]|jgi:hypothetical protein|uniref:Uncharacterized protein n=1 Tax=Flavobacterium johnsoniae (strain ATCC 17061 / DSM 2064 / JCM 8514 / BCRC 14874 / CCUG 350202 / NBRC 14942 / NCIMB 11054 / UW101) TaxID=376686 RepID=A5FFY9_FLAJ1|nr:hypothetical protein [Flavobacterium johnsoniae]ABQ05887.1 hypothetical protein Fjoh_2866 [Flavobacterium johnsoniae UW101]OXE95547.1 hypothetical protein B0A63_24325 [Flavobacterium johnsoniae UW101]WQG81623.1 hypothetical protein SR927_00695 [Flavobacterium johnsoniae UW101]SHK59128.1 hypothetical protein SAMN05444146_1586 [Flavobacterium johnsoniae]